MGEHLEEQDLVQLYPMVTRGAFGSQLQEYKSQLQNFLQQTLSRPNRLYEAKMKLAIAVTLFLFTAGVSLVSASPSSLPKVDQDEVSPVASNATVEPSSPVSLYPWKNKHAIIFTDAKLDDSVMFQMLMRPKKYELLHIVTSGIRDHAAAHGHLDDFFRRQRLIKSTDEFETTSYLIYNGGEDILNQSPRRTHEQFFLGTPLPSRIQAYGNLNKILPRGAIVDIYHVAPTDAEQIYSLADEEKIRIRMFYHLAGYNSYQDKESHVTGKASEKTMNFLRDVGARIRATHPSAIAVFTASPFSFKGSTGSTQPLEAFKGRINDHHLTFALQDPFFVNKLTETEELIAPLRRESPRNLPPLMPPDRDFRDRSLQSLITTARFMQPEEEGGRLRKHFLAYLMQTIPPLIEMGTHPKLVYRLRTAIMEALEWPPTIELADAVQAVCVLDALKLEHIDTWPTQSLGSSSSSSSSYQFPQLVPIHWHTATEAITRGMAVMRAWRPEEDGDAGFHGFSITGQTAEHARELLYRSMPLLPEYRQ